MTLKELVNVTYESIVLEDIATGKELGLFYDLPEVAQEALNNKEVVVVSIEHNIYEQTDFIMRVKIRL